MSGTTITSSSAVTLTLSDSSQNPVTITGDGTIVTTGSYGIQATDTLVSWLITNDGMVSAAKTGVVIDGAGSVTNGNVGGSGGTIVGGSYGIRIDASNRSDVGTVTNFGTVSATGTSGYGIDLLGGGTVVNGATNATTAEISGGAYGVIFHNTGSLDNYGTIASGARYGIEFTSTGSIVNGSAQDSAALVQGYGGIFFSNSGTVSNFGTFVGTHTDAVIIRAGGEVANGSDSAGGAEISGYGGIAINTGRSSGDAGTVANFGSIVSTNANYDAVFIGGVGTIDNGSPVSTGWGISGAGTAVFMQGAGTIANYGTITGGSHYAVDVQGAVTVTNGAGASTDWTIQGTSGIFAGSGTIANDGTIIGTTKDGIMLGGAGSVTNGSATASGRAITGSYAGVDIDFRRTAGQLGTVTNFGTISATGFSGKAVVLGGGGDVANGAAGASIYGASVGVYIVGAGTVTNVGAVVGASQYGVDIAGAANVTNGGGNPAAVISGGQYGLKINGGTVANSGTIQGNIGIYLRSGGTVTNSGAIVSTAGPSGTALQFAAAADLIVAPGAVFTGTVSANASFANTLELQAGDSGGSLGGLYTAFQNFTTIAEDAGAAWTLTGTNTIAGTAEIGLGADAVLQIAGTLSGGMVELGNGVADVTGNADASAFAFTAGEQGVVVFGSVTAGGTLEAGITGFAGGDRIEAPVAFNGASVSGPGIVLTENGVPALTLANVALATTGQAFVFGTDGANDYVSIACFAAGTRIATARGDIPVEALAVGDTVRAHFAGVAEIVWLGHRLVECRRHPRPWDVWPVHVAADAFGPGAPARALVLSPDHAVFVGGALVPVRYLLNGATIVQRPADSVDYWHVELARHDVIQAEGLPCESYLDTGNRAAFANGGAAVQLQPDFARRTWRQLGCAALVVGGARLATARQRLLRRAARLGFRLSDDADVHLTLDGAPLYPAEVTGQRHRFAVRGRPRDLRLVSHSAVPAEVTAAAADHRRLGVMLTRVAAFCPFDWHVAPLADQTGPGFHRLETDGDRQWRWTDGNAALTLPDTAARDGVLLLDLDIAAVQPHWRATGGFSSSPARGDTRPAASPAPQPRPVPSCAAR